MHRLSPTLAVLIAVGFTFSSASHADDWPQWRGPLRDGISREQGLAKSWPTDGPKLLWKKTGLGEGFSTPSIARGILYTMGNLDGEEYLLAFDLKAQGKPLWKTSLGSVRHAGAGYPGPRSTPTVDGDRIYCVGLNGDFVCADAASGRIVWRHDYVADYGGRIPTWGYCESPLIDGDRVVGTPGGSQASIVAFDKATGKQTWSTGFGDGAGYASLINVLVAGAPQYVQFTSGGLVGVHADGGKLLWRYDAPANGTANCSTAVVHGDRVFGASGYGTGGGAADISRDGAEFQAREAFFTKEMKNHHGGLVLVDGHVYGSDDPGILRCIDLATGQTKWQDRAPGKCSLIYFEGLLIARSERGKVSLVKVSPEACEVVSEFEQPDRSDKPSWPHPVVANGVLYLRDQDLLLAYDVKAK
ncbi:MAG: PQQ-like beta-propeller repeat protein [Planctomycetes bacterium]|nr:PQQ-like beta-propeller repeat protein [Planctomycetota bacterium]